MIEPGYCGDIPHGQTAVDIFKGLWKSKFPQGTGIEAGNVESFEDRRISWIEEKLGTLGGMKILELGPFEGYHTWQLSKLGCSSITAVEGNNINFLKCLVVKEVLDVKAKFLFGDIGKFLDDTWEHYHLCVACGVLYHQVEPLRLIRNIARKADAVFLWTHFFDARIFENIHLYPHFSPKHSIDKGLDGYHCLHYCRRYGHKRGIPAFFSGGNESYAYWLLKDDILEYLRVVGFSDITIRRVNMEHKAGPAISLLATR